MSTENLIFIDATCPACRRMIGFRNSPEMPARCPFCDLDIAGFREAVKRDMQKLGVEHDEQMKARERRQDAAYLIERTEKDFAKFGIKMTEAQHRKLVTAADGYKPRR